MRIGFGQGFWGDWLEAPVRLLEDGPLDVLALDYLAEVTMSILQKQKRRDGALGYARDFPELIGRIAGRLRETGARVVANAGGVNPVACAEAVRRAAPNLRVAVVLGDDLLARVPELVAAGHELRNLDTGAPVTEVADRLTSANVYLGAFPIAEALAGGAQVVITGRCADAALVLGPMIQRFGWKETDWDRLAAGVTAGHIVECGAQCTGGNCQADWQTIPDLESIGYPVVEAEADGTCVITKQVGTGGRVSLATVKEQLVYEVEDPRQYFTPDVVADFTSVRLSAAGPDRVRVEGAKGRQRPEQLKVSASYAWGWKAVGTLTYSWPDAVEKARVAERIVRGRLERLGLRYERVHAEWVGVNACHVPSHGPVARRMEDPAEVQLRMGVRDRDRAAVERFTREMIPLVLNGPPTATGYGDGRPEVKEVIAYWPALIGREAVEPRVEVL
jgi:hypothetical protein